jgi:hypothetical protein
VRRLPETIGRVRGLPASGLGDSVP